MQTLINKTDFPIGAAHRALSVSAWDARLKHAEPERKRLVRSWSNNAYAGAKVAAHLMTPVRLVLGTGNADYIKIVAGKGDGHCGYSNYLLYAGHRALSSAGLALGAVLGAALGLMRLHPNMGLRDGAHRGWLCVHTVALFVGYGLAAATGILSLGLQASACLVSAAIGVGAAAVCSTLGLHQ